MSHNRSPVLRALRGALVPLVAILGCTESGLDNLASGPGSDGSPPAVIDGGTGGLGVGGVSGGAGTGGAETGGGAGSGGGAGMGGARADGGISAGGADASVVVPPDASIFTDASSADAGPIAPTDGTAVGTLGARCVPEGASACGGHAGPTELICIKGRWVQAGTCGAGENCDTNPGQTQGTCAPIVPACASVASGALSCQGNDVIRCGLDLVSSQRIETCGFVCTDGACAGECSPATRRCSGFTPESCDASGAWVGEATCQSICSGGACAGTCTPNAVQCNGNTLQTCDGSGSWIDGATCQGQACVGGQCQGVCTPGATQCVSQELQTCDSTGQWGAPSSCNGQACVAGACTGLCAPLSKRCSSGGVQTCGASGQWGTIVACNEQACALGACSGVCQPGTKTCNGTTPRTCDSSGTFEDGDPCSSVCSGGACSGTCTPNDMQCNGNTTQICDGTGTWQDGVACIGQACVTGACTGICAPGAARCSNNGVQTCTNSGQWSAPVPCVASGCVSGACTGVCVPGAVQCSNNGVQTCNDNGQWSASAACANQACLNGACTGFCAPGTKVCNGLTPQTCDASGLWQSGTLCANVCSGGACGGTCSPGAKQCNGLTPQTCDGLGTWQDGPACTNSACAAGTCTGVCVPGTKQCSNNGVQTCGPNGLWSTAVPCVASACSAGACTGVCVPGMVQCSGNGTQICASSGQWGGVTACQNSACVSGTCTGSCTPGAKQCNTLVAQTCDLTGTWQNTAVCTNVCNAGTCSGSCSPGTKQCTGQQPQTCSGSGTWQNETLCSGQACVSGACSGVCAPGSVRCSLNGVQTCDGTGQWGPASPCVSSACSGGVCTGVCVPGSTQCSGNGVQTCNGSGQWGSASACAASACVGGACVGVCLPGTKQCNGLVAQTCDVTGAWQNGTLCTYVCTSGACAGVCQPGSTQCGAGGVQTCDVTGAWGTAVPCGATESCVSGACVAATCSDGNANGLESDVDCGGSTCGACALGRGCNQDSDCGSGTCVSGMCRPRPSQLCIGQWHSCAITDGGRVLCWGDDGVGELGYGGANVDYRRGPIYVKGLTDATQIDCGKHGHHTCAVRANGNVVCWGDNGNGRLGDGTTTQRQVPTPVNGLTGAVQVTTGSDFSCARLSNGEVRCWGYGGAGRLGRGSITDSTTPVIVLAGESGTGNLSNVAYLASGDQHTCAVLSSAGGGRVVCWGEGAQGRLGNGGTSAQQLPVYVHGLANTGTCTAANTAGCLANVVMVDGGENVTLAIQAGGLASAWGDNNVGENGTGVGQISAPRRMTGVNGTGTFDDAAWVGMGQNHGCAIRRNGDAVCWGEDDNGRLGDNDGANLNEAFPVPVSGGTGYQQIDASDAFTCGLLDTGRVRCWGDNFQGMLGDGLQGNAQLVPEDVSGARGIVQADGGYDFGCVVTTSGELYCFGYNAYGQLGTGDTADRWTPVRVSGVPGAVEVAGLGYGVCAVTTAGKVTCWGYDGEGQNGDGTVGNPTQRTTPVDVVGVTNAKQIAGGLRFACALTDPPPVGDGQTEVWCWGQNNYGQLGDGTVTSRPAPVRVTGVGGLGVLSDAVSIGAGYFHACAVRKTGDVVCWGLNNLGQLGDNTAASRATPAQVKDGFGILPLTGMAQSRWAIDASYEHTCVLGADRKAYCWGNGGNGEIGNNAVGTTYVPVQVGGGLDDFGALSASSETAGHTCAVRASGAPYCWGWNGYGQLGTGDTVETHLPVRAHLTESITTFGNADFGSPVLQSSGGAYHTFAVHQNGTASAWGLGGNGRLGNGYTAQENAPVSVCAYPQN